MSNIAPKKQPAPAEATVRALGAEWTVVGVTKAKHGEALGARESDPHRHEDRARETTLTEMR